MKYPLIHTRFFVLLCLIVSTMACQSLLPGSETPTVVSIANLKPMILTDGKSPSFIDVIGSLPDKAGTYLVYSELFSEQAGQVKYVSTGGTVQGDLLSYSEIDNWFPSPFMSSEQPGPRFAFTDYHEGEITLRNNELRVWITNSFGEPLYSWHLNTEPSSNADCDSPSFSPSGHWMVLICSASGQYYVDLVNLASGGQKVIPIPDGATTVPVENWSQDENHFYIWSHTYIYCFVSLLNDVAGCSDVGKPVLSVSPDWQHVVLFNGDMPYNPDRTVPGVQISIVDMECVLNGSYCENSMDFELPFRQSMAGNSYSYPTIRWNASGSKLAWMNSPYIDQASQESVVSPSCGWITLSEKTSQFLCEQIMSKAFLLDISPDENWLLLSDERSLYLLSTREPDIRRLLTPTSEFGVISFYGWIIVQ